MKEIALKAKKRDTGKQVSKRIRREGLVPGIFYMNGEAALPFQVNPMDLRPIVYTASKKLISLELEGESPRQCVLKDIKFDPVTDSILHVDFLGLHKDHKVNIQVPVVIKGSSLGQRKGGNLQQVIHTVGIKCLPANLVDAIEVDITNLDLGKSIHFRDLNLEGVEFNMPLDAMICAVNAPRGSQAQA